MTSAPLPIAPPRRTPLRRFLLYASTVQLLLTVLTFGDVLLIAPADTVLSYPGGDVTSYFGPLRHYTFTQLRQTGRLPTWNPAVFCGAPLYANPQAAVLYPPNWLHLVLPTAAAINWGIALHFFLAGVFAAVWARARDLSTPAALFVGACLPLTGGYFLHYFPGHLGIDVLAWSPLVLASVEYVRRGNHVRLSAAIGAAAVGMSVLGGHPQTVYYTALIAIAYLVVDPPAKGRRLRAALLLAAMYGLAFGLTAVQLLPQALAVTGGARASGMSLKASASGALPLENFLDLIAPVLFGDDQRATYTGRWFLWETGLYVGASVTAFAACGATRPGPNRRLALGLLAVSVLLATAPYLPIYPYLRAALPFFGLFRVTARFKFFIDLALLLLAAHGIDAIIKRAVPRRTPLTVTVSLAALTLLAGLYLHLDAARATGATWAATLQRLQATGEVELPAYMADSFEHVYRSAKFASSQFLRSASVLSTLAVVVLLIKHLPRTLPLLFLLPTLDLYLLSLGIRPAGPLHVDPPDAWKPYTAALQPGQRTLTHDVAYSSSRAMLTGQPEVWGYDPLPPLRLAEFLAFSQDEDLNTAPAAGIRITRPHPMLAILRTALYFLEGGQPLPSPTPPLPHAFLVTRSHVIPDRDTRLAALASPSFDPRTQVILESSPNPAPAPSAHPGTVILSRESPDSLEFRADLPSPAVLVITDSYAPGWAVRPLQPTPPQPHYDVLPADHAIRAVPLAAGSHHFRLEYTPPGLRTGAAISAATVGLLCLLTIIPRLRPRPAPLPQIVSPP